ncbi:MAG: S41 family peptidase [Sphingopyxis sp.]
MRKSVSGLVVSALLLASCGGGGGGTSGGGNVVLPPSPTPTPTAGCSTRERQDWALAQMREWYLFPETLPASPNPGASATVQDYIDALTATARSQGRDRYFTYITSIAQENAFLNSGSSAGFGFRLSYDTTARRVFIAEAFEGAPALAAGIDRSTEILAIGTTAANLRTVSDIILAEGTAGVTNALGPSTVGTARVLRVADAAGGTRNLTVVKADYSLTPVSSRYGSRILDLGGGRRVGYLNLRTFITSADQQLRDSYASFRAQGISEFIVDLRYNGGGLVSTANLFGDLLGGGRRTSDIFSQTRFRTEKSSNNDTHFFSPTAQSVTPVKIAFIGTGSTASASELVINGMIPFLGPNMALIGGNTYGKPVGQIALDRTACDDRLRVIAFATGNASNNTAYYTGLAASVANTCRAADDITLPLGDIREASVARAIDFLSGRTCTAISSSEQGTASSRGSAGVAFDHRELLIPDAPTPAQREVPGLF